MSVEFKNVYKFQELEDFISQVETQPEWEDFMTIRESAMRLISIRGRLIGEKQTDMEDLLYDLNSFRQLGMKKDRVASALQAAVTVEGSYYEYAQRLAVYFAKEEGYLERIPEYKDVAKEIVAWNLWYRWKPRGDIAPNGLHYSMVSSLRFIPQQTYKSYLHKLPLSSLFDGIENRGNKIGFHNKLREMPEYRLRRALSTLTLREVFSGLEMTVPRKRLPILCVMGYIPGVKNMTQGVKNFNIDTETFRNLFDSSLDEIPSICREEPGITAKSIVDETLNRAIIRDSNGTLTPFHSPRLVLLNYEEAPHGMGSVNEEIFYLARELNGDAFCHNLTEIGEAVGNLTKNSVSKRIKRIADACTN